MRTHPRVNCSRVRASCVAAAAVLPVLLLDGRHLLPEHLDVQWGRPAETRAGQARSHRRALAAGVLELLIEDGVGRVPRRVDREHHGVLAVTIPRSRRSGPDRADVAEGDRAGRDQDDGTTSCRSGRVTPPPARSSHGAPAVVVVPRCERGGLGRSAPSRSRSCCRRRPSGSLSRWLARDARGVQRRHRPVAGPERVREASGRWRRRAARCSARRPRASRIPRDRPGSIVTGSSMPAAPASVVPVQPEPSPRRRRIGPSSSRIRRPRGSASRHDAVVDGVVGLDDQRRHLLPAFSHRVLLAGAGSAAGVQ